MTTEIQGERRSENCLADLLDTIRVEHEERWQVNAEYYRAAMRDLSLIRTAILAIFVMKCVEWYVSGS